MKMTIESTSKIIELQGPSGMVQARVWEGTTDKGIEVIAFITRVAVAREDDTREFDKDLQQTRAPTAEVAALDLRLIL